MSQFIRQRCLNETLTNSELVNELMIRIAQKIELECAKNYPILKGKEYTEDMLHPPKIVKSSEAYNGSTTENKETKKTERSCYVGFTLTKEEKVCLKDNSTKAGYNTISKYIRHRCLKEQISKKDVINILLSFFAIKFTDGLLSPDRKLEWKRKSVKKRMNVSFITLGMDEKKKEKFEKEFQELAETYSKDLQEELTSILLAQKNKIENEALC